jgi:hypothetical protein
LPDPNNFGQFLLELQDALTVIKGYIQLTIEKPEKNYNILIIKEIEKIEKMLADLKSPPPNGEHALVPRQNPGQDHAFRNIRVEVDKKDGEGATLRIYIPC